jgi:hypothetical protein
MKELHQRPRGQPLNYAIKVKHRTGTLKQRTEEVKKLLVYTDAELKLLLAAPKPNLIALARALDQQKAREGHGARSEPGRLILPRSAQREQGERKGPGR